MLKDRTVVSSTRATEGQTHGDVPPWAGPVTRTQLWRLGARRTLSCCQGLMMMMMLEREPVLPAAGQFHKPLMVRRSLTTLV